MSFLGFLWMLSGGDERDNVFAFLYAKVTKCLIGKPVTKKSKYIK